MVARLIKSSRPWSIVIFAGICVAALATLMFWPSQPPAVAQLEPPPPLPGC